MSIIKPFYVNLLLPEALILLRRKETKQTEPETPNHEPPTTRHPNPAPARLSTTPASARPLVLGRVQSAAAGFRRFASQDQRC